MPGKLWTQDELTHLECFWGVRSVPQIARALGRTQTAVREKAYLMGLGPYLLGGDYVTLSALAEAMGRDLGSIKSIWVKNRGLRIIRKTVVHKSVAAVRLPDFWRWAERNRDCIDFTRLEPLALGKEPEWMEEERRRQSVRVACKKRVWTADDDQALIDLARSGVDGDAIAARLRRTLPAVMQRARQLGVVACVRSKCQGHEAWTDAEVEQIRAGIAARETLPEICGRLPHRAREVVRAKMYSLYGTSSIKKIRAMEG